MTLNALVQLGLISQTPFDDFHLHRNQEFFTITSQLNGCNYVGC